LSSTEHDLNESIYGFEFSGFEKQRNMIEEEHEMTTSFVNRNNRRILADQ
jgi:hypothetical protein